MILAQLIQLLEIPPELRFIRRVDDRLPGETHLKGLLVFMAACRNALLDFTAPSFQSLLTLFGRTILAIRRTLDVFYLGYVEFLELVTTRFAPVVDTAHRFQMYFAL
jgi:hypothetical protein